MDIHAPDKPILNFKEFAVHIAVVTVGILIALSLEGVREIIHERHLVAETRVNFHAEVKNNLDNDQDELARVEKINDGLTKLIADLPL